MIRSADRFIPSVRHDAEEDHASEFSRFAECLRRELSPSTVLEGLLAERAVIAAWRLQELTTAEHEVLERSAPRRARRPSKAAGLDLLRAERALERALNGYHQALARRQPRWGQAQLVAAPAPTVDEHSSLSNEWPVVPTGDPGADSYDVEGDEPWHARLVFDFNVSETSPVVQGTWVTAGHVISLIVDGWTWSDILRAHPELTEDDIRACLAYTVAQDNGSGF